MFSSDLTVSFYYISYNSRFFCEKLIKLGIINIYFMCFYTVIKPIIIQLFFNTLIFRIFKIENEIETLIEETAGLFICKTIFSYFV